MYRTTHPENTYGFMSDRIVVMFPCIGKLGNSKVHEDLIRLIKNSKKDSYNILKSKVTPILKEERDRLPSIQYIENIKLMDSERL